MGEGGTVKWRSIIACAMILLNVSTLPAAEIPPDIAKELAAYTTLALEQSNDEQGLHRACSLLSTSQYYLWLNSERDRLIPMLARVRLRASSADVLGLLDPPPPAAERLRLDVASSDRVRARLGDSEALTRLISAFDQTVEPDRIEARAIDLLYVYNHVAMTALARRLSEPGIHEQQMDHPGFPHVHATGVAPHVHAVQATVRTAIALPILNAYARVHVHVPLFSTIREHIFIDEEAFKQDEHQRFLRAIEARFREVHGIDLQMRAPLLMNALPIEHD